MWRDDNGRFNACDFKTHTGGGDFQYNYNVATSVYFQGKSLALQEGNKPAKDFTVFSFVHITSSLYDPLIGSSIFDNIYRITPHFAACRYMPGFTRVPVYPGVYRHAAKCEVK